MKEIEGMRKDQTPKLGKPLSVGEEHIYRLIHLKGPEAIETDELFKQHFGIEAVNTVDRISIWCLIHRARQKLGEHAIVSIKDEGQKTKYATRRALIENRSF